MIRAGLTIAGLAVVLAACDGGGDPVQQALRDASAARHAAATPATAEVEPTAHDGHAPAAPTAAPTAGATPGDRAFAASEALMHRQMAAASGQTVDQAYIAKMIAHHEGAVAMAQVALRESRDPEIRRMAQAVIDAQTHEIAEMKAWTPNAVD